MTSPAPNGMKTAVAALYVEAGGCYFGLPGVDPWDETRDARTYSGPYPVIDERAAVHRRTEQMRQELGLPVDDLPWKRSDDLMQVRS